MTTPATLSFMPDLANYDHVVVAFSGGKDSLACVLRLLDLGVSKGKIELWHHDVDGGPNDPHVMDWPVTRSYCRAVADALGLPIRFSWREGGFLREMNRDGTPTAPVRFELADGTLGTAGGRGPAGTRGKFPQVSADLSVRWCSAYLKIDVGAAAIRNDPRFKGTRTLVVTGERREESAARAKYKEFEPHRSHGAKRHVDQWRAVIDLTEADVWALIERHSIVPHPAYQLGFGRTSCMSCIFGDDNQWASVRALNPEAFERIAQLEDRSGLTIHRKDNVRTRAARGLPLFDPERDARLAAASQARAFTGPVVLAPGEWRMPAGAFRECSGPT